jgi:hypothetical protein
MIVAELRDAKQGYRVRSPLTGALGGVPPILINSEAKQSESDVQPPLRPGEHLS